MSKLVSKCLFVGTALLVVFLMSAAAAMATVSKEFLFTRYSSAYSATNIYEVSPAGGTATNITSDSSTDLQPSYSAAANKIAFLSNRNSGQDIYTMAPGGGSVAQLTTSGSNGYPAWSADGTKIAYVHSGHLHVMNADGTSDAQVGSDTNVSHPTWSPDGSQIAYTMYASGGYVITEISSTANSTTAGSQKTSVSSISCGMYCYAYTSDQSPAWSPDGTGIAFSSNRASYPGYNIYVMNADGSGLNQVTHDNYSHTDADPTWESGGNVIYYDDGWNVNVVVSGGGSPWNLFGGSGAFGSLTLQNAALPIVPSSGASYVALGDSVAAGEGINYGWGWTAPSGSQSYGAWGGGSSTATWQSDSYSTDNQHCHQSSSGYPAVVQADMGVSSANFHDFACTGASAMNGVLETQTFGDATSTSSAQIGSSSYSSTNLDYDYASPDVVTLTVGADDVHFTDYLNSCYGWTALFTCDTSTADSQIASYLATQKTDLETVLQEIYNRGVTDGKVPRVILTTYFNPFPRSYDGLCPDITIGSSANALTSGTMIWLEQKLDLLNQNIINVASQFSNVVVVPLNQVLYDGSGKFHGLCSDNSGLGTTPWIYGPSLLIVPGPGSNNSSAPFHPTATGQSKIAALIEAAW